MYKDTGYGAESKALSGRRHSLRLTEEVLDGGDAEGAYWDVAPSLFVFLRVILGFTATQDYRSAAAGVFTLTG